MRTVLLLIALLIVVASAHRGSPQQRIEELEACTPVLTCYDMKYLVSKWFNESVQDSMIWYDPLPSTFFPENVVNILRIHFFLSGQEA
jgi:hypothetical protein